MRKRYFDIGGLHSICEDIARIAWEPSGSWVYAWDGYLDTEVPDRPVLEIYITVPPDGSTDMALVRSKIATYISEERVGKSFDIETIPTNEYKPEQILIKIHNEEGNSGV